MKENPEVDNEADGAFNKLPPWHLSFILFIGLLFTAFVSVWSPAKPAAPIADIRIKNSTGQVISQVLVNGKDYGLLQVDEVSQYQKIGPAYRYANIRFFAGGRELRLVPEDYVGETVLERGKYTYVIKLQSTEPDSTGGIELNLIRDNG